MNALVKWQTTYNRHQPRNDMMMVDLIDGGVDDPLMQDNICWSIWESGSFYSSLQDV